MNYKIYNECGISQKVKIKITDQNEIAELTKLYEANNLPKDIEAKVISVATSSEYVHEDAAKTYEFYKIKTKTDEEITEEFELKMKYRLVKSNETIASALNFFKVLTIIGLIIIVVAEIISLLK